MNNTKDTDNGQATPTGSSPTPWQFATDWYDVDGIHAALQNRHDDRYGTIPTDHASREFAEWLAHEYRLAMAKGIQIGQGWAKRFKT